MLTEEDEISLMMNMIYLNNGKMYNNVKDYLMIESIKRLLIILQNRETMD